MVLRWNGNGKKGVQKNKCYKDVNLSTHQIRWMRKRQVVVALSTTEVEYMKPLMQ
jgi:hypothetical protein